MANSQPLKPRKIPLRRCTGCGQSFPKKDLIRVVRSPEGDISLDFTGRKNGRGAYVCKNPACFKKARKNGRIASGLDCTVPDEVMDALQAEIDSCKEEDV